MPPRAWARDEHISEQRANEERTTAIPFVRRVSARRKGWPQCHRFVGRCGSRLRRTSPRGVLHRRLRRAADEWDARRKKLVHARAHRGSPWWL